MHNSFRPPVKKIIFYFLQKKGSVNEHMKLVGFGASNKVKNHCLKPLTAYSFSHSSKIIDDAQLVGNNQRRNKVTNAEISINKKL